MGDRDQRTGGTGGREERGRERHPDRRNRLGHVYALLTSPTYTSSEGARETRGMWHAKKRHVTWKPRFLRTG